MSNTAFTYLRNLNPIVDWLIRNVYHSSFLFQGLIPVSPQHCASLLEMTLLSFPFLSFTSHPFHPTHLLCCLPDSCLPAQEGRFCQPAAMPHRYLGHHGPPVAAPHLCGAATAQTRCVQCKGPPAGTPNCLTFLPLS